MIRDCIYNTDPHWAAFIKSNDFKGDVNFWRQGTDHKMHLKSGSNFFFRDVHSRSIIGRATFDGAFYHLTIDKAWERFGTRNGVSSLEEFRKRFSIVYNVPINYDFTIGSIVLSEIRWLEDKMRFPTSNALYHPKIVAFKYFEHGSVPELEARFNSNVQPTNSIFPGIVSEPVVGTSPSLTQATTSQIDESINWHIAPAIDLAQPEVGATRILVNEYRVLRDTAISYRVKTTYNFRCQLCSTTIQAPSGKRYAEAHHIKPLGAPHNGPDVFENVLCVCPNCHAKLDYGIIPLDARKIDIDVAHNLGMSFIQYHNDSVFNKVI